MGRHQLPPLRALSIAARRLDLPRKPRVAHPGRVTSTQVKAMRRKLARLPRHKDPRLRHTSKGRRFAEMVF
jgi:ribosomal protein L4